MRNQIEKLTNFGIISIKIKRPIAILLADVSVLRVTPDICKLFRAVTCMMFITNGSKNLLSDQYEGGNLGHP